MNVTPASIVAVQDKRLVIDWFLLLKASPYFAAPLIRWGFSANAITILWGVINVATASLVYVAIAGHLVAVPFVVLGLVVSEILDTSDGEVARFLGTSSPVGGKLLDGVAHKATEYALISAYVCGAAVISQSPLVLPVAAALLSAEAMQAYSYERRLLIIRLHMQSAEKAGGSRTRSGTYEAGTTWRQLAWRDRLKAIAGLFTYKFAYAAIAIATWLPAAYLWVLLALAVYKHVSWVRLIASTLRSANRVASA